MAFQHTLTSKARARRRAKGLQVDLKGTRTGVVLNRGLKERGNRRRS